MPASKSDFTSPGTVGAFCICAEHLISGEYFMASAIPPHFDYTGRAGSSTSVPRRRAWQHTDANGNQTASRSSSPFDFLLQSSNAPRVAEQRRGRQLLFHGFSALQYGAS